MKYDDNIHEFISKKLKEITGSSIIVVASYQQESRNVQVEEIMGLSKPLYKKLNDSLGNNLHKLSYKLSPKDFHLLVSGKLIYLEAGIKNMINKGALDKISGLLEAINVKHVHTIGLTDKEELMGAVLLINPYKNFNKLVAETFINQASIAILNKNVVNALHQSETRFRTLFEKNNDIIFTLDDKEHITSINPIGKKLITGKPENKVKIKVYMTSESYKRFKRTIAECVSKEVKYCAEEIELYSLNGDLLTFKVSFLITYMDQKVKEIFGIARNTTRDKMMQNQILSKIIETEEREKKAFSEELHDGLGSLLSTINIYIGMLMKKDKTRQQKEGYLDELRKLAHEAVSNVRLFSNSLTPNVLNDFGLIVAIKLYSDRINTTRPGLINVHEPKNLPRFDRIIEINLYRIILELINNSLKYAQSTSIDIDLDCKGRNIILQFRDNGRGFDMDKVLQSVTTGAGIKNIMARVKSLNGTFDFTSQENKGVSYHFVIPKNISYPNGG
jgi:PAS domain S-box-containing protein